jgi:thioester reductase-like protein
MPAIAESSSGAVHDRVMAIVAGFLRVDAAEIDPRKPFSLYALDSLALVELTAALEDAFERPLPEWLLVDHPDVESLTLALRGQEVDDDRDLMSRDSVLPADIRPSMPHTPRDPAGRVLLTGATGFLGAHLVHTLVTETAADVWCLVRAGQGEGLSRVRGNLERYGLWSSSFASRIEAIGGDLSVPRLGLSSADYARLAEGVDAIYHAGADVDWVRRYRALRDVNVIGTRELLRLACEARPAAFHFVSSLSVCYATDGPASVGEQDDMQPFVDRLPLGYAQTKCVAESLVRQAARRGLPISIHRPSLLAGDSRSGASNADDLLAAMLKGCIRMAAAPDLDWLIDAPPVDHVARAIVRLSTRAAGLTPTFHFANPCPRHWRECIVWMNLFGYRVVLLPYAAWREKLAREAVSPDHPLHGLRRFFLRRDSEGRTTAELYQETRKSRSSAAWTRRAAADAGLFCPRLDAEMLERYFDRYIEDGVLPTPAKHRQRSGRLPTPPTCHEDPRFVERLLRKHFDDPGLRVREHRLVSSRSDHSIIGELTSWRHQRRTGLFEYAVTFERRNRRDTVALIVKAKPADREVLEVAETVGGVCHPTLGRALADHGDRLPVRGSHLRELAIYEEAGARAPAHMPMCYGTWRDDDTREWGLALERIDDAALIDSSDEPGLWSPSHIDTAIAGLADLHAAWYRRDAELLQRHWIGHVPSRATALEMTPLWRVLGHHAEPYLARWTAPAIVSTQRELIESVGDRWSIIDRSPRTLVHNDFNTRNIAIRRTDRGIELCAYDWELATVGIPQSDLAELLCFVLPPDVAEDDAVRWVEHHRAALARATGASIDGGEWLVAFGAALDELLINRLAFYVMINRVKPQAFLPRIVNTWWRLHGIFS